ncbi:AraC family transcriptional regulator [Enterococcus sp.]|uniref:AraC family transcriptional regulator n=1 Tax=Enterococcus sp. TaxID=35783 RepID=UPI002FCB66A7
MSHHLLQQEALANIIERYTRTDGQHPSLIPTLSFTRISKITDPAHGVYTTSLCVIAQGEKEALLSNERYTYNPNHYLIASVELPVIAQITKASSEKPYLALKLDFSAHEIIDCLREMALTTQKSKTTKRGIYISQMEQPLLDALLRLVYLLETPADISVLAPLIKKEIIYRLLQSEHREQLIQIGIEGSTTQQVAQVIQYITKNYEKNIPIKQLTAIAQMSPATLYRHFNQVTTMSPIQFQKELRLQTARRLLISEPLNAADVAFRVGYESPSQFSREYSRMFGRSPKEDVKFFEEKLTLR